MVIAIQSAEQCHIINLQQIVATSIIPKSKSNFLNESQHLECTRLAEGAHRKVQTAGPSPSDSDSGSQGKGPESPVLTMVLGGSARKAAQSTL